MPTLTKKFHGKSGKLVIINLQPTKHDKKADLIIRAKSDLVMKKLFEKLGEEIPLYDETKDPVTIAKHNETVDWTQTNQEVKCWKSKATSLAERLSSEKKQAKEQKSKTSVKEENRTNETIMKTEGTVNDPITDEKFDISAMNECTKKRSNSFKDDLPVTKVFKEEDNH